LNSELEVKKKELKKFKEHEGILSLKATEHKITEHKREMKEKDTSTRLAKLQGKLDYCNLELEKKFEEIVPNYKVCFSLLIFQIGHYIYFR